MGAARLKLRVEGWERATAQDLVAGLVAPAGAAAREIAKEALATAGGSLGRVLALADRRAAARLDGEVVLQLRLAREVAIRVAHEAVVGRRFAAAAPETCGYLRALLAAEPREALWGVFLDAAGVWVRDEEMGCGTVDHAPVYPREIAARALELDARGVVLAHNHPSGDPQPSAADIEVTGQVAAALRAVGVALVDHLVVGAYGLASFESLGLLP